MTYKIIKLERYNGRLGNNIYQLRDAICLAIQYKYDLVEFPKHCMFNTTYINISNHTKTKDCEYIIDGTNVFVIKQAFSDKIMSLAYKYLQSVFIYGNMDIPEISDLVIHIRSGDVFSSVPHGNYIQPPLNYYTQIINKIKPKKILILTEDRRNPCTNKLLQLYPNATLAIKDLHETIKIVLAAKIIVFGIGTFIVSLLNFSKNIQSVYAPHAYCIYNKNIGVHKGDMSDYIATMGNIWKNTPKQREIMLTYNNAFNFT